jgi:hypothetical protein
MVRRRVRRRLRDSGATTPVELSSFTASVTAQNFVQLAWVTQSETDMLGYNVLRGDTNTPQAAVCMNADIIPAGNQSMETCIPIWMRKW